MRLPDECVALSAQFTGGYPAETRVAGERLTLRALLSQPRGSRVKTPGTCQRERGREMPWRVDDGDIGKASTPRSGSARASLLVVLMAAGAGILLLRLGSGHTPPSQRFASRPEFDTWAAVIAAELAAASVVGIAAWPAFLALGRATGRRAVIGTLGTWLAVGLMLGWLGPHRFSAKASLWLVDLRLAVVNIAVGGLMIPAFAGLVLAQTRLRTLRRETPTQVAEGSAGSLIVELLWMRTAMLRFLTGFAVVISGAVLAAGALRAAVLADGLATAQELPATEVLIYGGVFTVGTALIFVPSYMAWQDAVAYLRDQLFPIPANGMPSRDWTQGRNDFDTMLSARSSAGSVFTAAFGILAPLAGSLLTTLIPTS